MAEASDEKDFPKKFQEITSKQSVDEQAMTFLRAFVGEFQGKFEEVLQLAEEFKSFCVKMKGHIQEMDEFECHQFLERKGNAKTVKDMRDELRAIDLDSNNRVAFIEFLLFTYKRTTAQMFTAKPSDHLVAKLEAAIALHREALDKKKKQAELMTDLGAKASAGDVKAKAELRRLEMADPADHTRNEMEAIAATMAAKRALRSPEGEAARMYDQEQERVAEEKRKLDEEEKLKKQKSRDQLAARKAALFGSP